MRIIRSLSLAILITAPGTALAEEMPERVRDAATMFVLKDGLKRNNKTVLAVRSHLLATFAAADLDGGGISESDAQLGRIKEQSKKRSSWMVRRLEHDLNGDGAVGRDELRRSLTPIARKPLSTSAGKVAPSEEQVATTLDELVAKLRLPDTDGDGSASFDELRAAALEEYPLASTEQWHRRAYIPPEADLDGDGVITRAEFIEFIEGPISRIDTDGDGEISQEEKTEFREKSKEANDRFQAVKREEATRKRRAEYRKEQAAKCKIPAVPEDAFLLGLWLRGGHAVSSVAIADETRVTDFFEIVVEAGDQPLFLIVRSGGPAVVRLSGAVERIAHLFSAGGPKGFVGVPKGRVTWADPSPVFQGTKNCRMLYQNLDGDLIRAITGRKLDRVLPRDKKRARAFAIPSGQALPSYESAGRLIPNLTGSAGPLWQLFLERTEGGVVDIDPESIVSLHPAKAYSVLPQGAGLAQLVEDGTLKIEQIDEQDFHFKSDKRGALVIGKHTIYSFDDEEGIALDDMHFHRRDDGIWVGRALPLLRATRAFQTPAGLKGRRAVIFRLDDGVPKPTGHLGESRVIEE